MNPQKTRNPVNTSSSRPAQAYRIDHLGCANCAVKMDHAINSLPGVEFASIHFATASMHVRFTDGASVDELTDRIDQVIRSIEPDARLVQPPAEKPSEAVVASTESVGFQERIKDAIGDFREAVPMAKRWRLAFGVVLFVLAILVRQFRQDPAWLELSIFVAAYGLLGFDVLRAAVRRVNVNQLFDEHFLMAIATLGAFAIGEYPEAVAVMLFYQMGEILQDITVDRSRKALGALAAIRPDVAHVQKGSGIEDVSPEHVATGQTILIRPGERVPLDATVIDGRSSLDTAALTGEPVPMETFPGEEILAGYVNGAGLLKAVVVRAFEQSAFSRILEQTHQARARKAPAEKFITRFAAVYTPLMVVLAVLIAFVPPLLFNQSLREWGYRALILLVISCPCALMLSIPLGYFGGIGAASSRGILVKGGHYLEKLAIADQVVFDKTGTLTEGHLTLEEILPEPGVDADQILAVAALAEEHSGHPVAQAVREAADALLVPPQSIESTGPVLSYREEPGHGVLVHMEHSRIVCGNERLMSTEGIQVPSHEELPAGVVLYVAVDGRYLGMLVLGDRARADAREALHELKALGVKKTVVLSGDRPENVQSLAGLLSIDEAYAGLLPGDKVSQLETILSNRTASGSTVYVGDGINDAPVLARADVGIAFGRSGTDAAIESADVVILSDRLAKLPEAIRIARKTSRIIIQNVVMAIGFKVLVMILSLLGIGNIWQAVFADVGVALLAVLNSVRVIRPIGPV